MNQIQFAYEMFDQQPLWRLIEECPVPPRGRFMLRTVGFARPSETEGGRVPDARVAIAFRHSDGRWTLDRRGDVLLDFEPNWFGPAPVYPPWPPLSYQRS